MNRGSSGRALRSALCCARFIQMRDAPGANVTRRRFAPRKGACSSPSTSSSLPARSTSGGRPSYSHRAIAMSGIASRFKATSGRVHLFNLSPAPGSQSTVCMTGSLPRLLLTDAPAVAKTAGSWSQLRSWKNIWTRSQGSEGAVWEWEAEGWLRGWTDTHNEALPQAWFL